MTMRCHRISLRFTGDVGDDVTDALADALASRAYASRSRPPADVWESAAAFLVRLDVPGVGEDDLRIVVHADALVVEGERRGVHAEGSRCLLAESRRGPFRFATRLHADVEPDAAEARLERGVLTVHLPKRRGGPQ